MISYDPVEISLNGFKDLIGFTLAVTLGQPFDWIVAAFVIIATILTVTQRQYILWNCAWTVWIAQWNPMVGSQLMPQSLRLSANSTTIVKVFQTTLPVGTGEVIRKILFVGQTSVIVSFYVFCVCLAIALSGGINLISISSLPFLTTRSAFIFVSLISPLSLSLNLIGIGFNPFLATLTFLVWISLSPALFLFPELIRIGQPIVSCAFFNFLAVIERVLLVVGFDLFFILRSPLASFSNVTRSAPRVETISRVFMARKMPCRWQIPAVAFGANLERKRQVEHSVSLSLSHKWVSADGVSCRRSGISLADEMNYSTIRRLAPCL